MDKPVRKIIRLDNYDYSKNGLYFITICTIDKNELLWATDVGDGAPDVPTLRHFVCNLICVIHIMFST